LVIRFVDAVSEESSSGAWLRFLGCDSQRRQLDFIGGEQILAQRFLSL